MKQKEYENIDQYDYLDDDFIEKVFDKYSLLIGDFLIRFSCLEHELNIILAESFVDDMHEPGYVIIESLNMGGKINLFYKRNLYFENLLNNKHRKLLDNIHQKLKSINAFRNIIVHANWQSLTKEGFLRTRIVFDYDVGNIKFKKVKISKKLIKGNILDINKVIDNMYKYQQIQATSF